MSSADVWGAAGEVQQTLWLKPVVFFVFCFFICFLLFFPGCRSTFCSADKSVCVKTDRAPMFQHGAITTTVTQTLLSTPLHLSNTHTDNKLSSVSLSFALSTKTCLTRSTTARRANVSEGRRMNGKYTRLRFCFLLFPPPVCAVVDHVECTSVW